MIGLRRHTVEVVEYEAAWASLAVDACREARALAGDIIVDLQHVGCTAVPGLAAKPILDIAAGFISVEAMPELIQRWTAGGFIYRGDNGGEGGHLFVTESAPGIRTVHLHAVRYSGSQWCNYLAFRDLLRNNAVIREKYADLKQELARNFGQDRASYTKSKRTFIVEALRGVVACMGNRPSDDQLEIDRLVKAFFAAFTNKNGVEPSVRRIYELFIPEGVVVKAVGQPPEVYSVRGFVEPREQLLSSGALTEFEEVELAARTHIVGNIAQRYCVYQKTGVHGGQRFETKGAKVLQFVRTPDGWRLSAVAWDDEREGLLIPDEVG